MNAQRTSAEETERTLRAESVLSDDRLPVKWDGEYITDYIASQMDEKKSHD